MHKETSCFTKITFTFGCLRLAGMLYEFLVKKVSQIYFKNVFYTKLTGTISEKLKSC